MEGRTVTTERAGLLPRSGERRDRAGGRTDPTDGVVFGVGNIDRAGDGINGHTLGPVQLRFSRRTVAQPRLARPDDVVDAAIERSQSGDDEAMVIGVGDVDVPIAPLVYRDLAGEGERCRGRPGLRGWAGGPEVEYAAIQPAMGIELVQHSVNDRRELTGRELALVFADDLPQGVNKHQRRPGAHAVPLPDGKFVVVDDGVVDGVATHGLRDGLGRLLLGKLGRVNADDGERLGVTLLQLPQLRKDMQAVNSAEGPEIEDHQPARQIGQPQRPVGVDPGQPVRKLRRPHLSRIRCRHRDTLPLPRA